MELDRLPRSSSAGATTSSDSNGLLDELEALNRVPKGSAPPCQSAESTSSCLSWHKHKTGWSSSCGARSTTFASSRSRPHSELFERRDDSQEHVWHSQGYEINQHELSNFPAWLEDNVKFSRMLNAPREVRRSFWNWRPIRALSHIGQHRLNCVFSVTVHCVEGLAPGMDGHRLRVGWQRKEKSMCTLPSSVFQGRAEFEETLKLQCTIYASRNAGNKVKYMPKFVVLVVAVDGSDLVVSKHKLDLSRLLAQNARQSQKAATASFRLVGKGSIVVAFGYEILGKHTQDLGAACRSGKCGGGSMGFLDAAHSFSTKSKAVVGSSKSCLTDSFDAVEECKSSGSTIAQSQESMDLAKETSHEQQSDDTYESSEEDNELVVEDHGIETNNLKEAEQVKMSLHVDSHSGCGIDKEQVSATVEEHDGYSKVGDSTDMDINVMQRASCMYDPSSSEVRQYPSLCTNETLDEKQIEFHARESEQAVDSRVESKFASFDYEADLIACEFLHTLQGLSDPDSPKTRLLRQFEEEMLLEGNDTLNLAPIASSIDRPQRKRVGKQRKLDGC